MEPYIVFVLLLLVQIVISWDVPCPDACACSATYLTPRGTLSRNLLKTVNCSFENFASFPVDLPPDTQALLLQGNNLTAIRGHIPNLNHLQRLDLSENDIALGNEAPIFPDLGSLQYLILKRNNISKLQHGAFSGLRRLKVLDLSQNCIDYVEKHAFAGLNHLETVDLSRNHIEELNDEWFLGMSYMQELDLSFNRIAEIDGQVFHPLTRMNTLSLRGNRISYLLPAIVLGVDNLLVLNLADNLFDNVPHLLLSGLPKLKILTIDNNPIEKVKENDFLNLALSELNINNMPRLKWVDARALNNLTSLHILQLHDNPFLTYISPHALHKVPNLYMLYIHNNNLATLPEEITKECQQIRDITLYQNPLRCDCNIHWIKVYIDSVNTSIAGIFSSSQQFVCERPLKFQHKLLKDVSLADIQQTCSPTTLTFFNISDGYSLGDTIELDCRSIGVPHPQIHWFLANGNRIDATTSTPRFKMNAMGTLSIAHAHPNDSGKYTCVAKNGVNRFDTSSTVIDVIKPNLHIVTRDVKDTYITLSWNTTLHIGSSGLYKIIYHIKGDDGIKKYIRWGASYHEHLYTVTELQPDTEYVFCISYAADGEVKPIECTDAKTLPASSFFKEMTSKKTATVLAIGIALGTILLVVAAVFVAKRFRRRWMYKDFDSDRDRVMIMSQIPTENLYSPPTTPSANSRLTTLPATLSIAEPTMSRV